MSSNWLDPAVFVAVIASAGVLIVWASEHASRQLGKQIDRANGIHNERPRLVLRSGLTHWHAWR